MLSSFSLDQESLRVQRCVLAWGAVSVSLPTAVERVKVGALLLHALTLLACSRAELAAPCGHAKFISVCMQNAFKQTNEDRYKSCKAQDHVAMMHEAAGEAARFRAPGHAARRAVFMSGVT